MWQHVLFVRFVCTITVHATKETKDMPGSDISLQTNKLATVQRDESDIDDRFERAGDAAPQILNFRFKTTDDDPRNIDFRWVDPDTKQHQKIDFHIDLPDTNNPQILELNLGSPALKKSVSNQTSKQNGRRHRGSVFRRIFNRSPQKVYKGTKDRFIETNRNFPYIAAIIINGRYWCAGALVDVNWVLTAAHCLNFVLHINPMKTLSEHVKVRMGSIYPHEAGKLLGVVGAVRHPRFEEEPVPHADVALLKLDINVGTTKYADTIKIYEGMKWPLAQSFVMVAGWGATRGGDMAVRDETPNLTPGRLKVRSQTYCADSYQLVNDFIFTPDLFCASLRNGSRDTCLYDAGSPAVQENLLVGIMSFGPEHCGAHAQPAVFIKAFYFRDFVKNTIASYKTTKELIQAMQDMNFNVQTNPPLWGKMSNLLASIEVKHD